MFENVMSRNFSKAMESLEKYLWNKGMDLLTSKIIAMQMIVYMILTEKTCLENESEFSLLMIGEKEKEDEVSVEEEVLEDSEAVEDSVAEDVPEVVAQDAKLIIESLLRIYHPEHLGRTWRIFSALQETLITAQLISFATEKDWSSLLNEDIWKQHWKD